MRLVVESGGFWGQEPSVWSSTVIARTGVGNGVTVKSDVLGWVEVNW